MKVWTRDLLVLIDASGRPRKSIESLTFVPPLRVRHLHTPPDPEATREEPLLYLVGETPALANPVALIDWLDRLHAADGAPAALLLPREGFEWCSGATHPQYCGILHLQPGIRIEAMERILQEARRTLARRWGSGAVRRASFTWNFTTAEAADPEQAWLLLESVLEGITGSSIDLSCLGMAFAEALTNAVEHGNLEMESELKDDTHEGLFRFFEERERRLQDPRYSRRHVRVTVELRGSAIRVRIRNQGSGFDPAALRARPEPVGNALSHGLGLSMIESLVDEISVSADGRCITLVHRIPRCRIKPRGMVPSLFRDEAHRPAA